MLTLNKTYNYSTLAPNILGSDFKNMKVKAILSSDKALKYHDIKTMHNTLRPVISNLPASVADLIWYQVVNADGIESIIAHEYIEQSSITEVTAINLNLQVLGVTTGDLDIIKTILAEHGYKNVTIDTFES